MTEGKLEIIPLGGIGEFGMNCMAVRYEDEMLILDAGMGFPEETAYGVDVCIPNFDFLEPYRDNITDGGQEKLVLMTSTMPASSLRAPPTEGRSAVSNCSAVIEGGSSCSGSADGHRYQPLRVAATARRCASVLPVARTVTARRSL